MFVSQWMACFSTLIIVFLLTTAVLIMQGVMPPLYMEKSMFREVK